MGDASHFTLGIAGAGLMGRGIAQVAAQAGIATCLYDSREGTAGDAKDGIAATFKRLAERGKLAAADADAALSRLTPVDSLDAFAACDVVVEAIVEDLDAKRTLFLALEAIVRTDCILATNTSSLSVTAIAAGCTHPERVAGLHFFSPVPLMKVVEVIAGARTLPAVAETLVALANRIGHAPVRAADTPGFIVNHAGRGFGTEALRVHAEGVAGFAAIDAILREGAGFRMGPFELMDLTGLDVSQPVMDSIYHQYYEEPRFRPSPLLVQRRLAGLLGRKTGEGFYRYHDGVREPGETVPVPVARPASIWISPLEPEAQARVLAAAAPLGVRIETGEAPSREALCIVTPLGADATTAAFEEGLDAGRTIAIDAWFGLASHRTLMTTPATSSATREAAHGLFASDGVPVTVIRDSAGLVAQRVVAHIVNIACDIAQQRIATPADIERAVTLGLGYPQGPLAMGDALGAANVLATLDRMHELSGDPRYRASPWLVRRARLGLSLALPER